MDLELVHGRLDPWVFDNVLDVMFQEIADTDVPDLSFFFQLNQGPPGLSPYLAVLRAFDVGLTDSGPVYEDEIKIVYS